MGLRKGHHTKIKVDSKKESIVNPFDTDLDDGEDGDGSDKGSDDEDDEFDEDAD